MKTKILCVFVILSMLLSLTACGNSSHSANNNSNKVNNTENSTENSNSYEENNYNTQGDFQSSLLNMAIEGEWIFYSNYYDLRDGIKRTLVDGGEYSKYNIETVFCQDFFVIFENLCYNRKKSAEKMPKMQIYCLQIE